MGREPRWVHKFEVKPGRWVFVPTPAEMTYGKALVGCLERYWSFPRYYYHLREGGHVAALRSHVRHRYFFCLDIENFFGSVNKSRVTRVLKGRLGYESAREIATRSTVNIDFDGQAVCCLPFGFPQSPFLASLALYESRLGRVLHALSRKSHFKVSVYVDDILISSNSFKALNDAFVDVMVAAERSGLKVRADKIQSPGSSVVSFNVGLSRGRLNITDARMKEFSKDYAHSASGFQRDGIVGYIKTVNPDQVNELFSLLVVM